MKFFDFFKSIKLTKKQKAAGAGIVLTTATLGIGSYFFRKKVQKMKEEGTFNTFSFKTSLNRYLKAAKKNELKLEIIDSLLAELDKIDEFRRSHDDFALNLDTDKYLELQEYLDGYFNGLKSSNNLSTKSISEKEESTEVRLRKCLNTQKYVLEIFNKEYLF